MYCQMNSSVFPCNAGAREQSSGLTVTFGSVQIILETFLLPLAYLYGSIEILGSRIHRAIRWWWMRKDAVIVDAETELPSVRVC